MALDKITTAIIADDAVTAAKIPAGAIGATEIADNAVSLAKMAGGTDGQIITYDASGDPAAVGPGTDGQVITSTGAGSPPAFEANPTPYTSSTFLDQGTLFSRASANTLNIPDLGGKVDGTIVEITATTKALGTSGNWDTTSPTDYTVAATRAGKDFYVYLLKAGGVILSASSTYPSGSSATLSRKIAGFHCLCTAAGTISGHTLTGYAQGDILPQSVWDRFNRPMSAPEGMVLSSDGMWIDIYLPSVSGTVLVSVNGGTIEQVGLSVSECTRVILCLS